MSVRATRRAAAREAILAAAHDQVAEGGYASASVAVVAARAGVATGSIYRHFLSKAELFAEVFRDAAGRELARIALIAGADSRPPAERLATAVEAFARRALAAPVLAHALMAEPVDPAVEVARLDSKRAYRDIFAALLREGVEAGDWPACDAPTVAAAIVGALQEALIGPLAEERRAGGSRAHDALAATLVAFVAHAVNTTEERRHGHRPQRRAVRHA